MSLAECRDRAIRSKNMHPIQICLQHRRGGRCSLPHSDPPPSKACRRTAGLALRCATFSAATHAAALLATRRPVFYARHRELLNGLIMLHVLLTTLDGGGWMGE